MSKIICPSCGAENEYGGICKYCGSKLDGNSSSTIIDEYDFPHATSNYNRISYLEKELFLEGEPLLFVNKLDSLTNVATTFRRDMGGAKIFTDTNVKGCLFRQKRLEGEDVVYLAVSSCIYERDKVIEERWDGKQKDFKPQKMMFTINNKCYELKSTSPLNKYSKNDYVYYFLIERDVLYEIAKCYSCYCFSDPIRLYDEEGNYWESKLDRFTVLFDACWFYNKIYDNSAFAKEIEKKNQWAIKDEEMSKIEDEFMEAEEDWEKFDVSEKLKDYDVKIERFASGRAPEKPVVIEGKQNLKFWPTFLRIVGMILILSLFVLFAHDMRYPEVNMWLSDKLGAGLMVTSFILFIISFFV